MASLQRHLYQTYKFDNFGDGFVEVLSAEQTNESSSWYEGTADAVRQQRHHFLNDRYDYILILSGDHLYQMNYQDFIAYHIEKGADITISAYPVDESNLHSYGIFKTDSEGRIIDFYEKPKDPEIIEKLKIPGLMADRLGKKFLASMGVYIFNHSSLKELLEELDEDDFGGGIIPSSLRSHKVYSYPYDGYWEDIGTIRSFYEANLGLTDLLPKFNLYDPTFPLYSRPRFLAPSKISWEAKINNCILGNGSRIQKSNLNRSLIGIRSIVKTDVTLVNTVLMGADYYDREMGDEVPVGIGEGTFIQNAIIDKNARIGPGCHIVNEAGIKEQDGDGYYIREGIIIVPKNGTIPPGTRI